MSEPAISVIMPCHNRAHDLARVLAAYDAQRGAPPFEIVAIDDGSRDATAAVLAAHRSPRFTVRSERSAASAGPAAARNRALELVRAPLALFVGDDILPAPDLIAGHVAAHADAPEPGSAVLGRVAWPDDLPRTTLMEHIDGVGAQQFSYHYLRDGEECDFRHFYTANVSIKTALARAAGIRFDVAFPFAAMEDAEFAYRLGAHGLRIRYRADLVAYHYHFHTIWSFAERQYRAGRMAALFAAKHPTQATALRVSQTRLLAALPLTVAVDRVFRRRLDAATLENQLLRLCSAYEWTPHPLLDGLYLGALDYFWQKGLIDGVFSARRAERVCAAYAAAALAPLLRRFIEHALAVGVPLPIAHPERLRAALLRTEPAVLRRRLGGRTPAEWAGAALRAVQAGPASRPKKWPLSRMKP
jgi:GT2 family glycosyltransferase